MKLYKTVLLQQNVKNTGVYILTLNRPASMNALNTKMATEIKEIVGELSVDPSLRVLILTASGEKSFCVGADLKERNGMTKAQWHQQHIIFEEITEQLRDFPYPVIAAINGYAIGGGMEIALNCDLRYFAEHAKGGLPESKLGLTPGIGGSQMLARLVPIGIAKEMMFRGNLLDAYQLKQIGLANEVFNSSELLDRVFDIAVEIAKNAPLSLKAIKKSVNQGTEVNLEDGIKIELDNYYICANSEDRMEGIRAFNEKRPPNWKAK